MVFFFQKNRAGYTLIELIVVVAILAILAIAGVGYVSSTRLSLQEAENLSLEMIALLRDARARALSGVTVETTEGEEIPEGGYGVFFDGENNTSTLFADIDNDATFSAADTVISDTPAYFPLLRLTAYRINVGELGDHDGVPISDSFDNTKSYYQKDFWIIFSAGSGEVTFGSEIGSATMDPSDDAITVDTKEIFIDIILEGVRHYHIFLNKVSRFLYLEQMSVEASE